MSTASPDRQFNDGDIVWPENRRSAIHLLLRFFIQVVDSLKIDYAGCVNDPITIAKQYLNGDATERECESAREAWWSFIDSNGLIRDFHTPAALRARVAVCLLSSQESEANDLGENLYYFLRFLSGLEVDMTWPGSLRQQYFLPYVPAHVHAKI